MTDRWADQYYWPLSSHRTVTVWVPLQATPLEMGPLAFAKGSRHFEFGRDLGANSSGSPHAVMTVIYMDADITLSEPTNRYHRREVECWMPGTRPGRVPASPLNPVLFQR